MSGSSSAPASSNAALGDGESRWSRWGSSAFTKSIKISDWAAGYANAASAKIGGERFWPKSDDTEEEIKKCERILRAFTVEGIPSKDTHEEEYSDGKGNKIKKKRKVLRKIPPKAIKQCKGIVIYTAMRSGIAPFGGAGGTGLVLARLPDGSWSAPASVSPNNFAVGLLLGMDIFDVILLLNTDKAVESFRSHKVTFGAETAIAAGPVGAGISMESGVDRAPIYSYVRSRGLYAGVEVMGQAFLSRFDENERFYYWPGIKAEDILEGRVRIPPVVYPLHRALKDAETGVAQGGKLERTVYDVVKIPESEIMSRLSSGSSHQGVRKERIEGEAQEEEEEDLIRDGEKLKLPPTPVELEALEKAGIPDEEDLRLAEKERRQVYQLPPPPLHPKIQSYWNQHPNKRKLRPTTQLKMLRGGEVNPHEVPLPPSPWEVPLPLSPDLEIDALQLGEQYVDVKGGGEVVPPPVVIAPPPRRTDGQGAHVMQEEPVPEPSSNVPLSPPPRRKDGQGAQATHSEVIEQSILPDEDVSVPLSPPPHRKDGQGATTVPDVSPPAVIIPEDDAQLSPSPPTDTLGKDLSEAEADEMIAKVQSGSEEHTAVPAEESTDTTVSTTPLSASGILPPPPRRPERKR